jgi:hypothetical protein
MFSIGALAPCAPKPKNAKMETIMAEWLKKGATVEAKADSDRKVRDAVEGILADIATRGDAAVRELSIKFDNWDRDSYRLTKDEIQNCIDQLTEQDLKDIEFAQTQVRNFAQIQRDSMKDVEVETLPGVVLGHKHLPLNAAGCYVPGGKYPLLASAHMSVITAKVAGVKRVITCAPPFNGKPAPAMPLSRRLSGNYLARWGLICSRGRRKHWSSRMTLAAMVSWRPLICLVRPNTGRTRPRSCSPPAANWRKRQCARLNAC